jgi:hypothetical protein
MYEEIWTAYVSADTIRHSVPDHGLVTAIRLTSMRQA